MIAMQDARKPKQQRGASVLLFLMLLNMSLIGLALQHTLVQRRFGRPRPPRLRRLAPPHPSERADRQLQPALGGSGSVLAPQCQCAFDSPFDASPALVDISVSSEFGERGRRDAIREGYGRQARSLGMRVRFFVGQATVKDVHDTWRQGKDVFAQVAHEKLARESEQRQFGDLVVLPMEDTYNNLTLKTLAMMSYTAACGRGEYYVKSDDDVFIFPWRLNKRLAKVRVDEVMYKRRMGVNMGSWWVNMPPITATDSKNFEPLWDWKGKFYTPFAGGPFYVISRAAIEHVLRNGWRLNTKWRNEDMAASTWLQGLDIEAVDEERIKLLHWKWSHPPYIALHNIDDREDIPLWHLGQAEANPGEDNAEGA
jgi:hypothetical protein